MKCRLPHTSPHPWTLWKPFVTSGNNGGDLRLRNRIVDEAGVQRGGWWPGLGVRGVSQRIRVELSRRDPGPRVSASPWADTTCWRGLSMGESGGTGI